MHHRNARAFKDLVIISLIAILVFVVASFFDAFDKFSEWFVHEKVGDIHELITVLVILSFAFGIFSMRRWRELRHEIAERRRAVETFRKSEERFKQVAENAGEWIWEVDVNGLYTYASPVIKEILGYKPEEIVGKKHFYDLFAPEVREDLKEKAFETFARKEAFRNFVNPNLHKNGTLVFLETSGTPFLDGEGNLLGYRGVDKDITRRKQTEEALAQKAKELERSNAELEQFASVVSHDLQEPLHIVSGYVHLLERRYKSKLDGNADSFVDSIVYGVNCMQVLIRDLFAYSRVSMHSKPLEPTNCSLVLNQALANLQSAIEESGAVITYKPLPIVMANSFQLVQLFQNLIGNAIKFRSDKLPAVHIGVERRGDEWVFSVHDNGIGIAPEFHERIFQIFQRLHSGTEYPGTGIGLAICKKIVEGFGGRIWVESESGEGSTFYFTILAID